MAIIVVRKGEAARKVVSSPIRREEYLQQYIREHPEIVPLDDIREDMQLFVFAREFPTPSGPIDALAIDDEGAVYIIETKLYRNPDKRLAVAQVLDYGAALWNSFDDYSDLETRIDEMTRQLFGMSFRDKLIDFFGFDEEQVKAVLTRFESDLDSGRFNFIFLMDRIHDELKAILDFMNANSKFRFLACEVEFYSDEDVDILVPKVYGVATMKGSSSTSGARRRWDQQAFFEDVRRRCDKSGYENIAKLFEFARKTADSISWGTGVDRGSFNPKYERVSRRSVFTVFSDGVLRVNFGWLGESEQVVEFRRSLKELLEERAGLTFPPDCERTAAPFPIEQWGASVEEIVGVLDQLLVPRGESGEPDESKRGS